MWKLGVSQPKVDGKNAKKWTVSETQRSQKQTVEGSKEWNYTAPIKKHIHFNRDRSLSSD